MKKKIVLCMILGCLSMALFGCTAKDVMDTVAEKKAASETEAEEEVEVEAEEKEEEAEEVKEEKEEVKEEAKEEAKEEETKEEEKKEEKKSSDTPVLGDEDAEDYEGFEYLFGEVLMTDAEENEETGKKERHKLSVFIPDDDYATVSGSRAYADYLGVDFEVELAPYIRYDEEDYLMEENLQYYLESNYDPFYSTDYKDLVISEVEVISETECRATVEYCYYNSWDDSYETIFATYYLAEMESGVNVLVEVKVQEEGVTGKTPALLEELEQFYQFEIDWDADRAAQKREDYLATGGDNKYSTGYLVFELPENWAEVKDGVSYDEHVYAPEGDVNFSGCMISFYREFLSYDEEIDVTAFVNNAEETEALLEEALEMDVTDFNVELVDTVLGEAAKLTYTASDDDLSGTGETYFVGDGYYFYTIQSFAMEEATEDPAVVLSDILQNAQVNE
ncbi:MAG: hypothetical protein IJ409_11465 [Lachnospiraceae bacterium]|nr:hypothetical protein [Lachnospiraceae bacterium]